MGRPKGSQNRPGGVDGELYQKMLNGFIFTDDELVQASCRDYLANRAVVEDTHIEFDKEYDEFFDGRSHYTAREICAECPIQKRCLEIALERHEPWGVWGGATPPDREKLRARMADEGLTAAQAAEGFNVRAALADDRRRAADNLRKKAEKYKKRLEKERQDRLKANWWYQADPLLDRILEKAPKCEAGHPLVETNVIRLDDDSLTCLQCFRGESSEDEGRNLRRESELAKRRRRKND